MTPPTIAQVKDRTNQQLQTVLNQRLAQAQAIDPAYAQLWQAITTLIQAGGKRLRPYLTHLSYATFSLDDLDISPVATAQELLHFALLAHDDIIDRDTIRYGQSNISGTYRRHYAAAHHQAGHYADGAALLAGDIVISQAYQLIATANLPDPLKTQALVQLGQSIFEVAGGELLDMEASIPGQPPADYFKIAYHKTATYSFIGPLLTGAHLAQASPQQSAALTQFGTNLGIAYQLSDDLLGVYGQEQVTGKPITSDLAEGKQTHFFHLILNQASASDRDFFISVWGNPHSSHDDVYKVQTLGINTGAKQHIEDLIDSYADQAKLSLQQLNLSTAAQDPFLKLIQQATHRQS